MSDNNEDDVKVEMPDLTVVRILFWSISFNTKGLRMTWDWALFLILISVVNMVLWSILMLVSLKLMSVNVDITVQSWLGMFLLIESVSFIVRSNR